MKISNKQYAISLFETVKELKNEKSKDVIANFINVLIKNNDLSKSNNIILEFNKVWNESHGLVEAEIISADKLDKANIKLLEEYIKKITSAKEVKIDNIIKKEILGGFILRVNDQVMDGSLKTKIKELKTALSK